MSSSAEADVGSRVECDLKKSPTMRLILKGIREVFNLMLIENLPGGRNSLVSQDVGISPSGASVLFVIPPTRQCIPQQLSHTKLSLLP